MIPKDVLKKVHQIEIKTQNIVDAMLGGEYQSVFKGKGMEFSEVRKYTDGDDIRSIDWNVTARTGEPHVKKHIEERELTVMMVVDASASGNFGTVEQMKSEMAVELCAVLAFSAIKNNDRVGLIIFTSEVEKYIPPKKGKKHVLRVIRELLYFKPKKTGTNLAEACSFLNKVQKRKAVVFFVSDFLTSGFETPLKIAARKHDCMAITFTDPKEEILPNVGLIELKDPETNETMLVDTGSRKIREEFKKITADKKESLKVFFKSNNIDEIPISTASDYIDPVVRFFRKREKTKH